MLPKLPKLPKLSQFSVPFVAPVLAPFLATIAAPFAAPFAPKRTLMLERNGTFDIDPIDISTKCGPVGDNRITYRIVAECKNKLDPNGFLIDHNDLAHYMESTFGGFQPVFPSCERMAEKASEGLWSLIRRHGVRPIWLTVSVAAFGEAGVTAKIGKIGKGAS